MKLNNKGYLIVEVVLAGALTFTMAYFLINLTLKIRNRADDVNVETVMLNDKTVITNEIMNDVIDDKVSSVEYITNGIRINFEDGSSKDLTIVNNTITYGTYTKKFSDDAVVGEVSIRRNGNYFIVEIPISTKYSNKDYGINIVGFTKESLEPLTCSLSANDTKIIANFDGNMVYYGWNSTYSGSNSNDKDIAVGTHTYYIKDSSDNTATCSITIASTKDGCIDEYSLNSAGDQCVYWYYAKPVYITTDECTCKGNEDHILTRMPCELSGSLAVCNCPPGSYAPYRNGECSKTISDYYCPSATGGEQMGGACYLYEDVIQVCPSGYTRVNDTYCSK